ncbi:MAG: hypothetical protein JST00_30075 [Deltaproteobacteria bacterium]|nr:hypothetical protein [Deltaproteobacteria bacterium]
MARRTTLSSIAAAAGALLFAGACVDLFHSTDFQTLCTTSPNDPRCGSPTTDAGTDVAAEASKPLVDLCTLSSAEAKARAIRVCAYLGACGVSIENNAFGDCVSRAQLAMDCAANPTLRPVGATETLWRCLAGINSCSDVETCVFGGASPECKPVDGKFTQCGGGARVECSAPGLAAGTRTEACALSGQRCTAKDTSIASCTGVQGYGACSTSECQGTHVVDCQLATANIDRGFDCATIGGGKCVTDPLGPACVPGAAAAACTGESAIPTCDGDVARACVGGKQIAIDCAKLGLQCNDGTTVPTFAPAGKCINTKIPGCKDLNDTCVGDELHGCAKNEEYVATCASLGLGPCKVTAGARATCTKP